MSDKLSLFRVTDPDSAAFAAVLQLTADYYNEDQIQWNERLSQVALETLARSDHLGRIWLLRCGEGVVGYAIVTFGYDHEVGGRFATLTDFFVCPDHRNCGHGTAALSSIEVSCRLAHCSALELQIQNHNAKVRRLYERSGFRALDRTPYLKILTAK